jgi:hypothetical protein
VGQTPWSARDALVPRFRLFYLRQNALSPCRAHCIWISEEGTDVPDWLTIVLVMAAYIVLMRWVLPRLGVGT